MALTFADFVAKFPPVTMPATLGEDTHHTFSTENLPLSDALIALYIQPAEGVAADDEFTEYLPCFAIADTEQFIALVWWKATLLNYEYVLATFTGKGHLIGRQIIAQTRVERDAADERKGVYRLTTTLKVHGALSDAQLKELETVARKCPVHKLMTTVATEITTRMERLP